MFQQGIWEKEINVRDFILANVTPYDGDGEFLAPPTERTTALWNPVSYTHLDVYKRQVLSEGNVAEEGAPEKLMKQNGLYARMVKLQTESQNWKLA